MALTGSTIVEVQTGGNDTNNGGMFDPSQTAGMFTDGAATLATSAAPVFTSASYSFVAGDVGAKLFIGAGTNWLRGWYSIASVSAGAATLNATSGQGISYNTTTISRFSITTVAGVASTASPTAATWSIDYSQQATRQIAYTDLASAGAGLTVSSVLNPFAKQQVGNAIVVTSGTNFTAGRYVIASVAASVATLVGPNNITTGAGVSGVGGLGGALASPGLASGVMTVSGMGMFWKSGAYSLSSTTANVATGRIALQATSQWIIGYDTYRMDFSDTQPVFTLATTFTSMVLAQNTNNFVANFTLDGNAVTFTLAIALSTAFGYRVNARNVPTNTFQYDRSTLVACSVSGGAIGFAGGDRSTLYACVAKSCTTRGFDLGTECGLVGCIAYNCTSGGFISFSSRNTFINCVAYNSASGFIAGTQSVYINCIAEANATYGFDLNSGTGTLVTKCATYNNGTNLRQAEATLITSPFIAGSSSFFTNAAAGDFSLNNTAGAGALLRGTGFPQTFPLGLTASTPDIGAAQAASGGGSSAGFSFGHA